MIKRIIVFTLLFSVIRADTYQNVSDAKTRQFLARQALLNNMQFRVRSNPIMRPQVQQPLPQQQQPQFQQPQMQAPQTTQQQQPLPQTQVTNGQVNQVAKVEGQQQQGQHCPTCKQPVNVNNAPQTIINNRLANTNQYGQQNYGQQNLNNPVNSNQQTNTKARSVFRNRFSNKRYRRFK